VLIVIVIVVVVVIIVVVVALFVCYNGRSCKEYPPLLICRALKLPPRRRKSLLASPLISPRTPRTISRRPRPAR